MESGLGHPGILLLLGWLILGRGSTGTVEPSDFRKVRLGFPAAIELADFWKVRLEHPGTVEQAWTSWFC